MPKLKYTGAADVRSISKTEFKGVDVEHEAIRAEAKNKFIVEVDEAAATYLLENESATWEQVKDEPDAKSGK